MNTTQTNEIYVMPPLTVGSDSITYSAPYPTNLGLRTIEEHRCLVELLSAIAVRNVIETDKPDLLGKTPQALFDEWLIPYQYAYGDTKDLRGASGILREVEDHLERFPDERIQAYVAFERLMIGYGNTSVSRATKRKGKQGKKRAKIVAISKRKNRR